ncbi:DUF262 domain-containing protein [Zunongwangia atlantica]|uniref:GmrSD restriction endonucleases N-terminal domain-containing protein n=1 Tax=Zunongwangia atlantica 22II14-10F7 TaxID=1185767 RepID=A0A1Y1SZ48_9FLAO|nr:DUF262 domain-containing protein [Zunongwangia atlantica]ORL43674.1 hypothetical protein IIF7_19649 [Zunongwangia atlantica 22II14-10F7]
MSNLKNKIEAQDRCINDLLKDQKFFIDYFQREYRWQEKHMVALVEDLSEAFLQSYHSDHKRAEVANYKNYYLGPVVFSMAEGKNSIIDGQQRITSITLLLIFLNNLQKESNNTVNIQELIFSEKYGEKSFNMTDEDRQEVLKDLFENGDYQIKENDDETVTNIAERYEDIVRVFPEELTNAPLPYFIDWLIGNVILVKITAYSDENAYTIFETMNDRGMSLTSTEMLKGYVLSKISNKELRSDINEVWKTNMQKLHEYEDNADLEFFKAWFRAKYAITVRPRVADSENQDFEQIGTRFHDWFKNNHVEKIGIRTSDDFYKFFKKEFDYMINAYIKSYDMMIYFNSKYPNIHYIKNWGIARSLQDTMLLASLDSDEEKDKMFEKMDVVSKFIETYTVRRAINFRKFGASAIQYTFFNIIKSIRDLDIQNLKNKLSENLKNMQEDFNAVTVFRLHQQNKRFVKHLLSRITGYIDQEVGKSTNYSNYFNPSTGKKYEIEHLWSDDFEDHRDEFEQELEFWNVRNSIGALVLLPNGTNQSFNSDRYTDKLPHYLKENTYAQTLHPDFYLKNPNFLKSDITSIPFQAHKQLLKEDIEKRCQVVQVLCEKIWPSKLI